MKIALVFIVLAAAVGVWWFFFRRGVVPIGGELYVRGTDGAPTASAISPANQSSITSSGSLANILANKTGTNLICKGVSTYYTGGSANGACGAVANIANKITQVQIEATKKVVGTVAPVAKAVVSATVVAPAKAIAHVFSSIF